MAFCGASGIPHSVFLGRVVEPGEPLWLPEDRTKALEWQAWEKARCPGCHMHHHDWQDDKGRELRDLPFQTKVVHCAICEIIEEAYSELPSDAAERRGMTIGLERVPTV